MSYPASLQNQQYYLVAEPYLEHGNRAGDRGYLAEILQAWSSEIDPEYDIGAALHSAIFGGDDAAVQMMMDAGVPPTLQQGQDPGFTPLLAASQHGRLQMVQLFWRLVGPGGRIYPSRRTRPDPLTCLQVAARNNHADVTGFLLDVWDGWDEGEKTRSLSDAAGAWCEDAVAILLSKVSYEPDAIQGALEQAIRRRMILPEHETRPDPAARDFDCQQRLVGRLIDGGANPDGEVRGNHWPLLHQAALAIGCVGALKGLLEKGANPNRQGAGGKTVLHLLFSSYNRQQPQTDSLQLLLQHGALPELADEAGETSLHAVSNTGTCAQLQLCLSHCGAPQSESIQLRNAHGESLLHYAAAGGQGDDIMAFLLESGLDVDAGSDNGWTPLLCALAPTRMKTTRCMCRTAEFLLQHGAGARVVTGEGWTPLHALASWAVGQNPDDRAEIGRLARRLISSGAPIATESAVVRRPSTGTGTLYDVWGFRMREFVENSTSSTEALGPTDDTTPLLWAKRSKATDVEDAIMKHLGLVDQGSAA